jgi:hypothetical protein
LAYQSNESKRSEIYVVTFPQPGGKWKISVNGGQTPVWSRDGHELYYYSADYEIMAVDIHADGQFQFGVPKPIFTSRVPGPVVNFDVSRDGHFLLPVLLQQQASVPMTVVLNWPEMLKKR